MPKASTHLSPALPKRPQLCRSVSSSSSPHFLFSRNLSGTIADIDIIHTLLEPFRPTDVLFRCYKTKTKNLGGFFAAKSIFDCSRAIQRMKITISLGLQAQWTVRMELQYKYELRYTNKKLSYRRGTARCTVSVEILPIAMQQCRSYLYDKS